MAIDKLALYNRALRIIGERKLASISEDRDPRHQLDDAWDFGAVDYCLKLVKPRFAARVAKLTGGSTSANHSFTDVHNLPSDYVAMIHVHSADTLDEPVDKYLVEGRTVAADYDPLWVRYVSNDASFGLDFTLWTPVFGEVVAAYLATQITPRIRPEAFEAASGALEAAVAAAIEREKQEEPSTPFPPDRAIASSATQLGVYNRALRALGQRALGSLTEASEMRYRLDDAWGLGAIRYGLERVKPRFATRVTKLTSGTSSSSHGFENTYTLPSDYVSMVGAYGGEDLDEPIRKYFLSGSTLAADNDTVFLRYVSDDASFGADTTQWSTVFSEVIAAYLAVQIAPQIAPDSMEGLIQLQEQAVQVAIGREGQEEPEQWAPERSFLGVTQLNVYNRVLRALGQREVGSLSEDNELRYRLDSAWFMGAGDYALEIIKPRFATRVTKLTASTTNSNHGFPNVFTLPSDYLTMVGVFSSDKLDEPITQYFVDRTTLSADHDTIYLRYTSNDDDYGNDTGLWTRTFAEVVAGYMAMQLAPQVQPEMLEALTAQFDTAVKLSLRQDADEEPRPRSTSKAATLTSSWYQVYNDALFLLGLPHLVSVNDDSERRVRLDHAVNQDAVKYHLEDTDWHWALTSERIDADPSAEPIWGYRNAFEKPTNMWRLVGVFTDEYLQSPLEYYEDETDYIFAEEETIYVQFIESDVIDDPQLWPAYFRKLIAAHLAYTVGPSLKEEGADVAGALEEYKRRQYEAKSNDAVQSPPRKLAVGNWVRSRWTWAGSARRRP